MAEQFMQLSEASSEDEEQNKQKIIKQATDHKDTNNNTKQISYSLIQSLDVLKMKSIIGNRSSEEPMYYFDNDDNKLDNSNELSQNKKSKTDPNQEKSKDNHYDGQQQRVDENVDPNDNVTEHQNSECKLSRCNQVLFASNALAFDSSKESDQLNENVLKDLNKIDNKKTIECTNYDEFSRYENEDAHEFHFEQMAQVDSVLSVRLAANIALKSRLEVRGNTEKVVKKEVVMDDGNEEIYLERLDDNQELTEAIDKSSTELHTVVDELCIPIWLWNKLYAHQRESLSWMWKLHVNKCGGIICDETDLGKTVQVIAFLVALQHTTFVPEGHTKSGLGPVLLVVPTEAMADWLYHFQHFCPKLRCALLHSAGTYQGPKLKLIESIINCKGVLITSLKGIVSYYKMMAKFESCWHYFIVDTGSNLRNADAKVTKLVKTISTPHRLFVHNNPFPNSLQELWSIFDFVTPNKLNNLSSFNEKFCKPIAAGLEEDASDAEIKQCYRCAIMLRNTIRGYLLRRSLEDVHHKLTLPDHQEQVLYCGMSSLQRHAYVQYIRNDLVRNILLRKTTVLDAIKDIRKICNHPALYYSAEGFAANHDGELYDKSYFDSSGKFQVLCKMLRLWWTEKRRVVLFARSNGVMNLVKKFTEKMGFPCERLDKSKDVNCDDATVSSLITQFNDSSSSFLLLFPTTAEEFPTNSLVERIKATRAVVYDYEWNPLLTIRNRERCMYFGRRTINGEPTIIYWLITAGTIEERFYHRRSIKDLITFSCLNDTTAFNYQVNELHELFSLNDVLNASIEPTGNINKDDNTHLSGENDEIKKRKEEMRKDNEDQVQLEMTNTSEQSYPSDGDNKKSKTEDCTKKPNDQGVLFENKKRINYLIKQESYDEYEIKKKQKNRSIGNTSIKAISEDWVLQQILGSSLKDIVEHEINRNAFIPDQHFPERNIITKEKLPLHINGHVDNGDDNGEHANKHYDNIDSSQLDEPDEGIISSTHIEKDKPVLPLVIDNDEFENSEMNDSMLVTVKTQDNSVSSTTNNGKVTSLTRSTSYGSNTNVPSMGTNATAGSLSAGPLIRTFRTKTTTEMSFDNLFTEFDMIVTNRPQSRSAGYQPRTGPSAAFTEALQQQQMQQHPQPKRSASEDDKLIEKRKKL